jgi:hypothetical protein
MDAAQRRQWRKYVLGCTELTEAQRLVLLALSEFADWPEGTNAFPGVKVLAEMCGFQDRVVKTALSNGRRLNLIKETQRANPKRGWASVYKLLPAPVSRCTTVHLETDFKVHETDFKVHENGFQGARDDVSRCTTVPPTKPFNTKPLNTGSKNTGGARASAAHELAPNPTLIADEENPSPFCRAHQPLGPQGEKCPACGDARRSLAIVQAAKDERMQEEKKKAAWDQAWCGLCDEKGWVIEADGSVADPAIRCTHPQDAMTGGRGD